VLLLLLVGSLFVALRHVLFHLLGQILLVSREVLLLAILRPCLIFYLLLHVRFQNCGPLVFSLLDIVC
jgi:hypothetical protein